MIQVLLYPDALSLVGSMNAFEIYNDSKTDVVFALRYHGAEQNIVQHTYTPNDEHRITVDVKDIILPLLAFELKDDSTPYIQENIMKAFSAEIYEVGDAGNRKEFSFSVIRAGVDKLADSAENFLKNNFLTWQPQVKAVTYYSPEFLTYYAAEACAVKCKAYLWNGTGYTESEITLAHLTEGCVYTIPVQYAIIAKALNQKTPSYYDVWVEKEGGDRLTYVQRYYASDMKSEEEEWFLFENSLGGVDCFRAYGNSENTAEHTHNVAEIEDDSEEYRVDTTRKFKKNTGYLDGKERLWLLDFFPSLGKYVYHRNSWRKITVTESDVNYEAKELPSNYTFTYRYSDARPYLNLPRASGESLKQMDIHLPDIGNFTIAPRLVEFPRQQLGGGVLFPVQDPHSEEWGTTTADAIFSAFLSAISNRYSGNGEVGHEHINISVLDALSFVGGYLLYKGEKLKAGVADVAKELDGEAAILKKYIRRDIDDTAEGTITFEKVQKLVSGLLVGNFNNENGGSWTPDAEGRSHLITDYLEVRMKAIFEELVIKKTSTIGGKEIISPAGGVVAHKVEEVTVTYNNVSQKAYRCYFLAEQDGDEVDNDFAVNDQVRSESFNVRKGTYHKVGNHFYWRLVIGRDEEPVELEGKKYHYIDLSDTDCATASDVPAKGDVLSQCGNRTDIERQNCLIFSAVDTYSPSIGLYHGINSYSFANREYVEYGVNKQTNKAFFNVYGDMYVGDRPTKENNYEGSSYIKYDSATKQVSVKGKISAKSTVDGKELSQYIKENSAKGLTEEQVNNLIKNSQVIADLQNQVDGAIETWFYEGEPTLTNAPASSWTTDKDKDTHLGDLYYDNKTGKAYRFAKDGSIYKWTIITDTDIAKALSDASKAQETADGKMKVFSAQPIPPYQLGDIWVNATYPSDGSTYKNEVLRCQTNKAAGSQFAIADWIKASKYTDDTVANAAKKAAEDAQKAAQTAQTNITNLGKTVTSNKKAFDNYVTDGYLEPSEIAAMAQDSKRLEDAFAAAEKSYNEVKGAEVLKSTKELTDLNTAFATLSTAKKELIEYLSDISARYNAADTNGKATIVSAVGMKFTNFQSAYSAFYDKLGLANAYITSKIYGDLGVVIGDVTSLAYLKKALIDAPDTEINGGLVLTSLIGLRDTDGNTTAGINGITEKSAKGGGIAAWFGGEMVDKDYNDGSKTPANTIFRFDGSGYVAGGAIWWGTDGRVHADPTSFIISEKNLGAYLTFFEPTWKAGSAGTSVADLVSLKPNAPFSKLGVSGDATFEGAISFHGIKLTYDATNKAIKIDGNLYATGGITAYGAASSGAGGGGLNASVISYARIIEGSYTDADLTSIPNAYAVKALSSRIDNIATELGGLSLSWNNITGKPSTFAPSAHTHKWTEITDRITKVSQLTNDAGYLTAHQSLASYYTKAEIDAKGYTTNKGTVTSVALTLPTGLACATKTITTSGTFAVTFASGYSIPTTTKQTAWDGAVSAKHTHSNKSVLDGISSVKVTHWDSAYDWYALMTTDEETADGIINKWNEVVSFLSNIAQTNTLSGIVDGINKSISDEVTRAKKAEGLNASGISTNKTNITTLQGYFTSGSAKKALQLTNARKLWGNSFNGTADINGSIIVPDGKYISIGNIKMEYDATNKALKITNTTTNEVANLYTSGGVSAYGVGTSSSSGGGLNGSVKAYADAIRLTTENISEIASAYSVAKLYSEIQNVASAIPSISVSVPTAGNALTGATYDTSTGVITFTKGTFLTAHQSLDGYVNAIAVSGSGNAVTDVTKSGKTISVTKGITFLTSHQSLANYLTRTDAASLYQPKGSYLTAHQSLDGYVNEVATSGTGNAITSVSKSGKVLTFTKSVTFLTSHQSLSAYLKSADAANTYSRLGHTHRSITGVYTSNGGQQNPNYFGTNKIGGLMMNTTVNGNNDYKDWLVLDCYEGNDVGGAVAIGINRQRLGAYIMRSEATRNTWKSSAELLGTHNYSSYVSPKTHTHSVKINGSTKIIAASGDSVVDLGTYLTSHQSLAGYATQDWVNAKGYITSSASITGNAATATKLKTARNIWGQNFDGTGGIDGTLQIERTANFNNYNQGIRIVGKSNEWCTITLGCEPASHYGYIDSQWELFKTNSDTFRIARGPASNSFLEIKNNGNVGIGTLEPSEKLEVCGNVLVNDNINSSGKGFIIKTNGRNVLFGVGTSTKTGVWDYSSNKWLFCSDNSTFYSSGNILATGGITAYSSSDIRLKQDLRKLDYLGIIKAMGGTFGFAWKKDNTRSIGFIAQHVLCNPHLKDIVETDENGYYKINYWSPKLIATAFGAIEQVGDEVSRLKARVVFLESEVQRLSGKQDSSDKKRLDNKNINLLN
ncbi:tail fiber domain-containing protein [Segatella copri]|uniref:tail fiber domain-containing protein n=1 Tax=Segatella copri TaxID=165179 RepID=UPI003D01263E